MAIFAADISSYEHGLAVADLKDCAAILAKCTEGTYYVDADYAGWRTQAKAAAKLFVVYHFISGEDPAEQAKNLAAHIGDPSLPVMLDWEPAGKYSPTLAQLYAVADAMNARGLRVRLAYVPRWYWAQLGGPDLSGLTARKLGMISSAYPGGSGTAAQLYPGDGAAGWQPYGGVTPLLYQYTNQAADGGQRIDMNAYKGSALQLAAFLGQPVPTPPSGGTAMPTIPDSIASQDPDLPEIRGMFPAGQPFDPNTALIWSDERAAAANIHAKKALDAVNALSQKVGTDDADAAAHLQQLSDSVAALSATVHELASAPTGVVSQVDPAAYAAVLAPPLADALLARVVQKLGA